MSPFSASQFVRQSSASEAHSSSHRLEDPVHSMRSLPEPALYRVSEVIRLLGLSRTVVYDLLRTGRLRSVKEGRTRLVPASAVREYVALLEREIA